MEWKRSKLFKDEYLSIGDWNFEKKSSFSKCEIIAADTETKLYYKGNHVNDDFVYAYYKTCIDKHNKVYNLNTFRQNIEVRLFAIMISNGKNFALFKNLDDFITCVTMMRTKYVVWYNTRFDFTLFDYYFLKNNWIDRESVREVGTGEKTPKKNNMYSCLNGDFGQRYQMKFWKSYSNNSRHEKIHETTMIDLCNVLSGGLAKNLKDFEIEDENGNPIRKLQMNYAEASFDKEEDIQYMINDTKGLYYLTIKFDKIVNELSGYSFLKGDYITAGGLAKKSMLKFMFGKSDKTNKRAFKYYFPMTRELDYELRHNNIYKGGISLVNPAYVNKKLHYIYKYDENSMYPDKMKNMKIPFGDYKLYDPKNLDHYKDDCIYVLKICDFFGTLKSDMIPFYMDTLTNDFVEVIHEPNGRYIWKEELELYERYYELQYTIEAIYEFKAVKCKGLENFVDNFYQIKSNTTNKSLKQCAKLFLNSSYGKLSQRINTTRVFYELDQDYGFLKTNSIEIPDEEISESSLLSIWLGSRITALARVDLGIKILKICKNNPKKYFVYCDTDSVHALCEFNETDDKELGKMKFEGLYENGIYLAPKTYLLNNGNNYEVHSKGVNTEVVENTINNYKSFDEVCDKVFKAGVKFKCLCALNVTGGRALFNVDKVIMKELEQQDMNYYELLNLSKEDIENIKK